MRASFEPNALQIAVLFGWTLLGAAREQLVRLRARLPHGEPTVVPVAADLPDVPPARVAPEPMAGYAPPRRTYDPNLN
jgi:hypothetical protein